MLRASNARLCKARLFKNSGVGVRSQLIQRRGFIWRSSYVYFRIKQDSTTSNGYNTRTKNKNYNKDGQRNSQSEHDENLDDYEIDFITLTRKPCKRSGGEINATKKNKNSKKGHKSAVKRSDEEKNEKINKVLENLQKNRKSSKECLNDTAASSYISVGKSTTKQTSENFMRPFIERNLRNNEKYNADADKVGGLSTNETPNSPEKSDSLFNVRKLKSNVDDIDDVLVVSFKNSPKSKQNAKITPESSGDIMTDSTTKDKDSRKTNKRSESKVKRSGSKHVQFDDVAMDKKDTADQVNELNKNPGIGAVESNVANFDRHHESAACYHVAHEKHHDEDIQEKIRKPDAKLLGEDGDPKLAGNPVDIVQEKTDDGIQNKANKNGNTDSKLPEDKTVDIQNMKEEINNTNADHKKRPIKFDDIELDKVNVGTTPSNKHLGTEARYTDELAYAKLFENLSPYEGPKVNDMEEVMNMLTKPKHIVMNATHKDNNDTSQDKNVIPSDENYQKLEAIFSSPQNVALLENILYNIKETKRREREARFRELSAYEWSRNKVLHPDSIFTNGQIFGGRSGNNGIDGYFDSFTNFNDRGLTKAELFPSARESINSTINVESEPTQDTSSSKFGKFLKKFVISSFTAIGAGFVGLVVLDVTYPELLNTSNVKNGNLKKYELTERGFEKVES
ncbi:hypothetical protein DASC09_044330 [Saccharomycopsis crataegensis]|uniref:Uncharacterized protein n=1 Tax=Saccharomycopsis crataegensis TaxID=43959 RepID=A0AAV5QSJ1_9ASCO|nr:hypothetical protein DASC09_044330 [Saccharomycopsis crataegensis]